ncbi:hypothetical protein EPN81_03370 [Patescibacteria group bacterium]|nr:MAG: hypothetical protein EPN81_03370 [Patescibacteria group bacterium]
MLVTMITVTSPTRLVTRTLPWEDALRDGLPWARTEQVRVLTAYQPGAQLTFVGRASAGQGGVILTREGLIHGHKMDPIGNETEFQFFAISNVDQAIRRLMEGHSVLIQGHVGRLALRWNPMTLEIYAEGRDSHT